MVWKFWNGDNIWNLVSYVTCDLPPLTCFDSCFVVIGTLNVICIHGSHWLLHLIFVLLSLLDPFWASNLSHAPKGMDLKNYEFKLVLESSKLIEVLFKCRFSFYFWLLMGFYTMFSHAPILQIIYLLLRQPPLDPCYDKFEIYTSGFRLLFLLIQLPLLIKNTSRFRLGIFFKSDSHYAWVQAQLLICIIIEYMLTCNLFDCIINKTFHSLQWMGLLVT